MPAVANDATASLWGIMRPVRIFPAAMNSAGVGPK